MLEVLLGIILFTTGFLLGVFERKVDKLKVKNIFKKPGGEILTTPAPEDIKKQEKKEFYAKIK